MEQHLSNQRGICEKISRVIDRKKSADHIAYHCKQAFAGIVLKDKNVMEIGAGEGVLSAFAAASGARSVVAIEPGAAGSQNGYVAKIHQMKRELDLNNLEISNTTFQEYDRHDRIFDVVIMWNSINHLDESQCIKLRNDKDARAIYLHILQKIRDSMSPSALLVIADCSPQNLFPLFHLQNPIVPKIEWEKHQTPEIWMDLLGSIGLRRQQLSWTVPYPLRFAERLLSSQIAAFCLVSHFRLVMGYT